MQRLTVLLSLMLALSSEGCASGKRWVGDSGTGPHRSGSRILLDGQVHEGDKASSETVSIGPTSDRKVDEQEMADAPGDRPQLALTGTKPVVDGPLDGRMVGLFRNTYYDFPAESDFSGRSGVSHESLLSADSRRAQGILRCGVRAGQRNAQHRQHGQLRQARLLVRQRL